MSWQSADVSVADCCCDLHSLDQVMALAFDDSNDRDIWKIFYREMEAQYFFHCGTLVLNKALKVRFRTNIWMCMTW